MSKTLLKIFFLLDYRDKDKNSYKKIIGVLLTYIISNFGLSVGYYFMYDYRSFAFMAYSANMFLVTFMIFSDFANLFFAKDNISGLLSYPIESRTIKQTKFLSAFIFICGFTLISSIPQYVFFYFYDVGIFKLILYPIIEILFTIFITSIFLSIYCFILKVSTDKANSFVYILQFVFFFFIIASTRPSGNSTEHGNIFTNQFTQNLPQKLFIDAIDNPYIFVAILAISLMVLYVFYWYYSKYFFVLIDKLYEIKPKKKRTNIFRGIETAFNNFADLFLVNEIQKASYRLTGKLILSSRAMKMRFIPLMMMPVIICVIGFFYEDSGYFIIANGLIPIINPSIAVILMMVARVLISNLKLAEESSIDIDWLYKSLPIKSPAEFYKGCVKFIYINFLIPLTVLVAVIISFKVQISTVLLNFIFIIASMLLYNSILRIFDKEYPFTVNSSKINSMTRFGEIMLIILFSALVVILQFLVFNSYIYYFISIIVILLLNTFFNKYSEKKNE